MEKNIIMKKIQIITLSAVSSILAILIALYLLLVPQLIDLNAYKSQIEKTVKNLTGLNLKVENIDFKTNLNLSVDVFTDKIEINSTDDKKLLSLKSASVNVPLLPLLFKNIEIKGVKINSPEIHISREKDGKYNFESILNNIKPSDQKQEFKLVNGIDIEIKNYKFNLDDNFYSTPKKFLLSGDLIKISDFNPEKFIKLETKGILFVQGKPDVNFNIKFKSELPFSEAKTTNNTNKNIDPLDGIVKYNFKSNIIADISLKNVQKDLDIDGFINFDGLTLKLKDKTLPESYGKLKFKGKELVIDSKLSITPDNYILIAGNIKDIKKNKLNLNVKTSDINLNDLCDFVKALNDVSSLNIASINCSKISGKLKADFKITDKSDFSGFINLSNTNILYSGLSKPILNINSAVKFQGNKLVFNEFYGFIDNNKFNLSGFIDSDNLADLKFSVNTLKIKTIFDLVNQSSMLKEIKPQLNDITSYSGMIKVEANIKGNLNKKISPLITVTAINPSIIHKQIGFPVGLTNGTVIIDDKDIELKGLQANILQSSAFISGTISDYSNKTPKPDLLIKIPALNMSKIKSLSASASLDKNTKNMINSIQNPSGTIFTNIKISPDQEITADASVNNVYFYYSPAKLPLRIVNGKINSDGKQIEIKNLNLKASNSPLKISGTVASLAKLPKVDLTANGYISGADIKKYSSPDIRKSITVRGDLPLNAAIAGYVDGWKLTSKANIDNLSYLANINNSGSKNLSVNIKGTPSSLSFFDSGLSSSSGEKLISITGGINGYSGKNPILNNVKISLANLSLSLVEPKGRVNLTGNISVAGTPIRPKATGNISINNISVPSMFLTSDSVALTLKSNEILVNTGILNIADSKFKINMALDNNLGKVAVVKNINITSDYLNADRLQKVFPAVPNQDAPVIVRNGKFSADKMTMNGLTATNTSFDFVINPMNMMKMTDLMTNAAGGSASGKIDMNLKNSKVSVDLTTKNMEINTLASAFANIENEIYGDMNGNIDISTHGYTPDQTANNAKGNIVFTVSNGKLVKLGSIQHLLKAKNILSQGLGAQVIDNMLAYNEAGSSNNFKKLTGNISLSNGTMIINELTSQGGDMSLFSKGNIRMSNNYAEITTYGTLSDRITSKLGRISDFSVDKLINNKLINKIPGQWGQVISDLRPKTQYPEVAKIPPLSRGSQDTDKHFVVNIQGNFKNPVSVKSFKVID
jgi:hypothetical protein